jgi:hypothetical protein
VRLREIRWMGRVFHTGNDISKKLFSQIQDAISHLYGFRL